MVKRRQPQLARVGQLSQAAPALGLGHQKISAPGASCHVALKIQGRTRIFQTCRVKNTAAEVLGTGLNKGIRRAFQRRKGRHGAAALLQIRRLEPGERASLRLSAVHLEGCRLILCPKGLQLFQQSQIGRKDFFIGCALQPFRHRPSGHGNDSLQRRFPAQPQHRFQLFQRKAARFRLPALPAVALKADNIHPRRLHGGQVLPDLFRRDVFYMIYRTVIQSGMLHVLSSRVRSCAHRILRYILAQFSQLFHIFFTKYPSA